MIDPKELTQDSLVSDLLANYGVAAETFSITLPMGEVLAFRSLADHADLRAFKRGAVEFLAQLERPSVKAMWGEFLPKDSEDAVIAYTISTLSVEPKFSPEAALKLLKATWIVDLIMAEIERQKMAYLVKLATQAKDEKKDSLTTSDA